MECRFCKSDLTDVLIDFNSTPAANSLLTEQELNEPENFYPLKVFTCSNCFLVQVAEYKTSSSIFNDEYVYFSSYSSSWLKHAKDYTDSMVNRFGFDGNTQIVEIASNDGYLLQYFKEKNIPVLGIEPTANTAKVAIGKGIDTLVAFFGVELATKLAGLNKRADLIVGNNVLAHVPDIVDFVAGLKLLLKEDGVITLEFPHLMQMVDNMQFDTIYHEHFSYLSFYAVKQIFESQGLELFDVDEIPTHGGSLRIYGKHAEDKTKEISANTTALLQKELAKGMDTLAYYANFQSKADIIKHEFVSFIKQEKLIGKSIAGYGAAAKGISFLNYCEVKNDMIDFVVDANPHKQHKWLPASHIPVVDEAVLKEKKPDYVVIFPWNIKTEVINQLDYVKSWGGKFIIAIPSLQIIDGVTNDIFVV
jgi:SAM-dependent methyltransferase